MEQVKAMPAVMFPLFDTAADAPAKATQLLVSTCTPKFACHHNAEWHSRLPYAQRGPWSVAFAAQYHGTAFAVALWHNPSARTLPQDWLELRRMAVAPNAPHCTASFFLSRMEKWIASNRPEIVRLISYQDTAVHKGTIYRAAGWVPAWVSKARVRDRSKARVGTNRLYRTNSNGAAPDGSEKVRWERIIAPKKSAYVHHCRQCVCGHGVMVHEEAGRCGVCPPLACDIYTDANSGAHSL